MKETFSYISGIVIILSVTMIYSGIDEDTVSLVLAGGFLLLASMFGIFILVFDHRMKK